MRQLALTRNEAEWLVDLLEDCNPVETGTWRIDMAAEVRELFGMAKGPQNWLPRAEQKTEKPDKGT